MKGFNKRVAVYIILCLQNILITTPISVIGPISDILTSPPLPSPLIFSDPCSSSDRPSFPPSCILTSPPLPPPLIFSDSSSSDHSLPTNHSPPSSRSSVILTPTCSSAFAPVLESVTQGIATNNEVVLPSVPNKLKRMYAVLCGVTGGIVLVLVSRYKLL